MRIPDLGKSWSQPVHDGIGAADLSSGLGHFPGTEEPGEVGNYALAGHRSGISDPPLRAVDRIAKGSAIKVTTHGTTYTYTVTRKRTVPPSAVNVIAQVPGNPHATPTRPMMTLVTCWPATGHSKRVIVEAALSSTAPS